MIRVKGFILVKGRLNLIFILRPDYNTLSRFLERLFFFAVWYYILYFLVQLTALQITLDTFFTKASIKQTRLSSEIDTAKLVKTI